MKQPLLFRISRLGRALFTVCAVAAASAAGAQITVDQTDKPIKDILKVIEASSDYNFFFNEGLKDLDKRVTVKVADVSIETAMDALVGDTGLAYQVINGNIVVLSVKLPEGEAAPVKGVVKNEGGNPLAGVLVSVARSGKGTTTGPDGEFSIDAPAGAVLSFSYLGMETQSITVGQSRRLDVVMKEIWNPLEEVVVIGYGTSKKSDLTGAVTQVKTDNLPVAASSSIATMLGGRAAGVTAVQNSAQPGGGVQILIRGAASTGAGNDPLYVIDGFPVSGGSVEPGSDYRYTDYGSRNPLNSINPNDIESIEILKDASSSAIYGARAANGVVLITTKRGHEGRAKVAYQGSYGIQEISRKVDMLSASEFMVESNRFNYEKGLFDGNFAPYGPNDAGLYNPPADLYSAERIAAAGEGTDWYDLVTRRGRITQHNLSVSGGTKELKYMASLNYFDQNGVVRSDRFKRMSGRVNIDHRINKIFSYGINATMSYMNTTNIPLGGGDFENSGLLTAALVFDPTLPLKDEDGRYSLIPSFAVIPNPVSLLDITDYTKTRRALVNGYVQAEPIPGLVAKVSVGFDDTRANRNFYLPKTTLYGLQEGGKASKAYGEQFDNVIEATLNYEKAFNENHKLSVLAGYSYQISNYEGTSAANNKFFTDTYLYNNLLSGEAARPAVSSYKSENKLASYFGRINYNLMDKYLFTFTMRVDGSSNFGANNRYGYFPSGAFAWRIKQENFLKEVKWMSDLKLRLSFGQTGNSNIGQGAFEYWTSSWKYYVFGDRVVTGMAKNQMANPNLKWETTTELNVGLDFGLFGQRLSGSFEFFSKQVKDLLGYKNLRSFMDVDNVAYNIGKTQSRGIEFTIQSVNITNGKFRWTTEVNFTRYVDRWLERNPELELSPWQKNDDPIRAHYGYVNDGIMGAGETPPAYMPELKPGQFKVKDMNGYKRDEFGNLIPGADGKVQYMGRPDGILDEADIVMLGTMDPGFSMGLGNTFQYAGFDLNIFFYGMFDRLVYNTTRNTYSIWEMRRVLNGYNLMTEVKDRWAHDNTDASLPNGFTTTYPQPGNFFHEPGWFIRCKNITLGYTFPHRWVGRVFSSARIFAEIGNPFVITAYTGNDPETDFKAGYPNQRSFMFGVDLTF